MPQHRKILIGFAVGAVLGLALDYAVEPLGRLFLRLLLLAVLPMVVSSLILGVAEMGDAAKLGRVALKTLGFTVLATGLSVLTGLVLVNALRPGDGFPVEVREAMLRQGGLPA